MDDYDYCYDDKNVANTASSNFPLTKTMVVWSSNRPSKKCHGDCNSDSDCEGSYQCFQRDGNERVPGCTVGDEVSSNRDKGYTRQYGNRCSDISGVDVIKTASDCWDAASYMGLSGRYQGSWSWLPQGCSKWGGSIHFNTYGHLRSCTYSSSYYCLCSGGGDKAGWDYCYDKIDQLNLKKVGGDICTPTNQCNRCQGSCNSDDDCKGSLTCYSRDNKDKIPGCLAGGSNDVSNWDYCYNGQTDVALKKNSKSGCSSSNTCARCNGDCDKDSDCTGNLKCFQRDNNEQIPGCSEGGGSDTKGYDYCYDVLDFVKKGSSECTSSNTCARCKGDCDDDNDCTGNLKCFSRDNKEQVPGCSTGGSSDLTNFDYCYDELSLTQIGGSECTSSSTCGRCKGECDSDADCTGSLKCFSRSNKEQVPGCSTGGVDDLTNFDFCYDELNLKKIGNSECTDANPCDRCEGDCDEDANCKGSLTCKQRTGTALYNGGASYCQGSCTKCQGDCNSDSDCSGNLKCAQRDGTESIIGCNPGGSGGKFEKTSWILFVSINFY